MELTMVNVIVTDIDGLNNLKKLWVFWSFDLKIVYDKVIIFLYDDNNYTCFIVDLERSEMLWEI